MGDFYLIMVYHVRTGLVNIQMTFGYRDIHQKEERRCRTVCLLCFWNVADKGRTPFITKHETAKASLHQSSQESPKMHSICLQTSPNYHEQAVAIISDHEGSPLT